MKLKNHLSYLLGAVFGSVLSVSAVGCLQSAFHLDASMGNMALLCVFFSCLCAFLFRFRHGGTVLLCAGALAAGYLWRQGTVIDQTASLLGAVTDHYHAAYGWPMLGSVDGGPVNIPLAVIGLLAAAAVSCVVGRRKNALLALPAVILPLAACLVVTNTVPDTVWLYLLMLGVALLLITDWVRRKGAGQGAKLTAMLALPVAAALGLLFLLTPKEGYVNQVEDVQDRLIAAVENLRLLARELTEDSPLVGDESELTWVDLSYVGPKSDWDYPVMRVTAPVSGPLYLREQDYNTYSGSGWVASRHRSEVFTAGADSLGQLRIQTYGARSNLFIPYYPERDITLIGGGVDNSERVTTYTFELTRNPKPSELEPDDTFTRLPADTVQWANGLAMELTADCGTREEMAAAIGNYVRQSAVYDLSTERMPAGEKDFARWFLEDSDTGYCVHFATAATVLLRATGMPARYVEGYLVTCEAGVKTEVTSKAAHAWAEYYDGSVWRVLEATPADPGQGESPVPTEAPAVLQTLPPQTEPQIREPEPVPTRPGETAEPAESVESAPQQAQKPDGGIAGWLWLLLAPAALMGQSLYRLARKRRLWNRGRPNQRARNRFAQLEILAKCLKAELPEELETLTQKAKYSQHTLTGEELQVFEDCRENLRKRLASEAWYQRLLLLLVHAIE